MTIIVENHIIVFPFKENSSSGCYSWTAYGTTETTIYYKNDKISPFSHLSDHIRDVIFNGDRFDYNYIQHFLDYMHSLETN